MKIGDRVRVIGTPSGLGESEDAYRRCLGLTFTIAGFDAERELFDLEIGEVFGVAPYIHSIWIEPACLEDADVSPDRTPMD